MTFPAPHETIIPAGIVSLDDITESLHSYTIGKGEWKVAQIMYGGKVYLFRHATSKAALRTLASVCNSARGKLFSARGKLFRRNAFAAFVIGPDGVRYSYEDLRTTGPDGWKPLGVTR